MTSGGLVHPQALRGQWYRWWRPLVGLSVVVGFGALLVGLALVAVIVGVVLEATGVIGIPGLATVDDAWFASPVGMLVNNLFLALGIPVALLATWAQRSRPGRVSSVTGRLRWPLVLGSAALALLLLGVLSFGVDLVIDAVAPGPLEGWELDPEPAWLGLSVVILLTTPLQAAGEEYFFRGWLSQAIGSWCRSRWLAILLPMVVSATLFALAHGTQSGWLFADRLIFGLLASVLVWRTGGLECAIGLHVVNNLLAFGWAIASGTMAESLLITEVPAVDAAISIGSTVVTAGVVLLWARRRRPQTEVPA
ncbi:CPBP family intramembrane glutamic endopeptidase [Antribacter gilvus]|uniref:CPBP family intramembrane glutamic endopeptidase n=1 Tax=Antribacter gilvus TaxID=2304675 RepID=UPI000F76F599|nr:CPBP family intramembrane glutamic endopeptidase [Antribacter gilvus]